MLGARKPRTSSAESQKRLFRGEGIPPLRLWRALLKLGKLFHRMCNDGEDPPLYVEEFIAL